MGLMFLLSAVEDRHYIKHSTGDQGTELETIDSESIPAGVKELRRTANVREDGILEEDVLCSSPSYAAAFVVGGHSNGLEQWKNAEGKTLKEIERAS